MKKIFIAGFLICFLILYQSCSKKPFACFQTDVDEDSVHVNQPITFSSACTSNGGDFFWEFYDNDDSVYFSRNVQMTFYDTGNVKVFLLVSNGNKTSSMTKNIHVNP